MDGSSIGALKAVATYLKKQPDALLAFGLVVVGGGLAVAGVHLAFASIFPISMYLAYSFRMWIKERGIRLAKEDELRRLALKAGRGNKASAERVLGPPNAQRDD
jgi:hypothetical protein